MARPGAAAVQRHIAACSQIAVRSAFYRARSTREQTRAQFKTVIASSEAYRPKSGRQLGTKGVTASIRNFAYKHNNNTNNHATELASCHSCMPASSSTEKPASLALVPRLPPSCSMTSSFSPLNARNSRKRLKYQYSSVSAADVAGKPGGLTSGIRACPAG